MSNIQDALRLQLMHALRNDDFTTIDELLEKGVNTNLPYNHHGWTPFMWVCKEHCDPEILAKFLKYGAKVDKANKHGKTPLHIAARYRSSYDCLQLLIDNGANPNAQDEDGNTPLMIALGHPQVSMRMDVVWNLFQVTDCSIKNHEGKIAYDIAKENEAFDDAEVLALLAIAANE